ncbi:IS481 family transposase [Mycobacterium shigaense]|nr:IS481 family transposase [Mycobacterium shigaense]
MSKAHIRSEVLVSHRNARTTFHGRLLMVQRYHQGWPKAHIAAAMGVSRKCVHTWIRRFEIDGQAGLVDRSCRPHTMPTRTPQGLENQIVAWRRRHRCGPEEIGIKLGVSTRTVSRVLRRRSVSYLRDCDPITGVPIRASKASAVRYERERPGELVHVDVKKLGRIPDGGGWRAHGRSEEVRGRGIGYDYVHSMVDDHSRLAYSEILLDEKGPTCAGFLSRGAAYFAACGITRIEQVITDNHLSYRRSTAFAEAVEQLGASQLFIKPHCPWQNGKAERYNRTLQSEWACRRVFVSDAARAQALAPWLTVYNTQRRHSSLGGYPPISRL